MSLFKKKEEPTKEPLKIKKDKPLDSSVPKIPKKVPKQATSTTKPKTARISSKKDLFGSLLLRPIITEKAMMLVEENNCFVFEVSPRANKISIKKAVEEIYNFTPIKVNIVKIKGKRVRYGRSQGRTKNKKRALVFLKKGDQIEFVKKG